MAATKTPVHGTHDSSRGPAVLRAAEFLRTSLAARAWGPGERLPTIRKLAALAGVSRNSMWQGVTIARDEQLIGVTRGGYITVRGEFDRAEPAHERGKVWWKKRILLERDIFDGRYHPPGVLPTSKELQATYGACAATLKKVLRSLETSGLIVPFKRSYRIPEIPKHKQHRATLVWLSEKISASGVEINNQRLQKLVDALEHQCAKSRVHIDFADIGFLETGMNMRIRDTLRNRESTIGYLVDIPWTIGSDSRRRSMDLAASLAAFGKPVGIIDSVGDDPSLPAGSAVPRNLRLFRTAGRSAGERVAQYLLGLGHRRAAFISQVHLHSTDNWSGKRLAGISGQFRRAGSTENVALFVGDFFDLNLLVSKRLGKIPEQEPATRAFEEMALCADPGRSGAPAVAAGLKKVRPIQSTLALVDALAQKRNDGTMVSAAQHAALVAGSVKANEIMMAPLFEKVLADRSITAWIACNDGTAVAACNFLATRNVKVPGDISVVGFDNTAESFERKLTTYDFNMAGIIHHVLTFIRLPDIRMSPADRSFVEVEGMIIERDTSGPRGK